MLILERRFRIHDNALAAWNQALHRALEGQLRVAGQRPSYPVGVLARAVVLGFHPAESGDVLAAHNAHWRLAPASTLKMLFADRALECERAAQELQQVVVNIGGKPEDSGSVAGAVLGPKAAITPETAVPWPSVSETPRLATMSWLAG